MGTYTTFVSDIASLLVVPPTDAAFTGILPAMINHAEMRIYRELDLLSTLSTLTSTLASGQRFQTIPTGLIVLEAVNVVSPAGSAPDAGRRRNLNPVTREFLDCVWPAASANQMEPIYFARADETRIIVAPTPDAAYTAEWVGTTRPAPLSASNQSTFLTANLYDLFIAAAMVFGSGYQRDFGAQSEDPKMGMSWESTYQILLKSADTEEQRKKSAGPGWQPVGPEPLATPPRS